MSKESTGAPVDREPEDPIASPTAAALCWMCAGGSRSLPYKKHGVVAYQHATTDGETVVCAASAVKVLEDEVLALREERDLVTMYYRRRVWMNHGCDFRAAYGDDGEMQCNARGCFIDFRRESIQNIEQQLYERAMASAALASEPSGEPEKGKHRPCIMPGCEKPDIIAPNDGTWPTCSKHPPFCAEHQAEREARWREQARAAVARFNPTSPSLSPAPPAQPSVELERESALAKALTDLHAYVEYCKGMEYVPSYNAPEMIQARAVLGIPALTRVVEALEKARRAVAPQVEREREAENIGGLMSLRLTSLLARYSAPCPPPCDHAHCPLLHELNAIAAPPSEPESHREKAALITDHPFKPCGAGVDECHHRWSATKVCGAREAAHVSPSEQRR